MPIIDEKALKSLANPSSNNLANSIKDVSSAVGGSNDTMKQIADIIKGINSLMENAKAFQNLKGQSANKNQIQPQAVANVPSDMVNNLPATRNARIKVNDELVMTKLNNFLSNIPPFVQDMTLKSIIEQKQGYDDIIKQTVIQIINEVTTIEYG